MLKRLKFNLVKAISVLLLAASFLTVLPSNAAYAAESDYDFSGNIDSANTTLDSTELLELYLGEELIEAEYNYLAKYGKMSLTFENGLSATKNVSVEYDFVDSVLTVTAREYRYTAKNGKELRWKPERVTLGEESKGFVSSGVLYMAVFDGVERDDSLYAVVDYALDITVDCDDMNSLINFTFNDLEKIKAEFDAGEQEYLDELAEYELQTQNYEAYLAYEAAMKKYNAYLSDKKAYDKALAGYNAYLEELEKYNEALAEYKAYELSLQQYNADLAAYQKYLSDLQMFEDNKVKYAEYLQKMAVVSGQLQIIEAARTPLTDGRYIYSTIRGPLVDKVLAEEKTLIKHFGVPAEIVYMAGDSTEAVRKFLNEYFALSTDKEKYEYYINNYEAFKSDLIDLTQSLAFLYRNNKVNAALKDQMDEGDDRKYRILVGQLAMLAGCLNGQPIGTYFPEDNEFFDENYVFERDGKGDSIGSLLIEERDVFVISDPTPLAGGYPQQMAEPIAPTEVTKPTMPTEPPKPTEPQRVADPGDPPAAVAEPAYVEKTEKPTDPPTPFVPDPLKLAVADAFDNGTLAEREKLVDDYVFTFTDTLSKKAFNNKTVDVLFCVGEDEILCTVDKGDRVIYPGSKPVKAEDAAFTYAFDGWVDENGAPVDLSSITEDICLYPHFTPSDRYYSVTFNVDGEEYVFSLKYGSMPSFDETSIHKEPDAMYRYTFAGWDKPLKEVTEDAEYVALFDKEFIMSVGGEGVEILEYDDYFEVEFTGEINLDVTPILEKIVETEENVGFKKDLHLSTDQGTLLIPYALAREMYEEGYVNVVCKGEVVNSFKICFNVSITDSDGAEISSDERLEVSLPLNNENLDGAVLYYLDSSVESENGESPLKKYVQYGVEQGAFTASLAPGVEYFLSVEYTVSILPSDYAITVDKTVVHPGEWITVSCEQAPLGVKLDRVFLIYSDGREENVTDGFYMPDSNVSVGAEYSFIEYEIIFKVGDTVLSQKTYRYGETVELPLSPQSVTKDGYVYSFVGWDKEISSVNADAVYEAVFSKTPVDTDVPDGSDTDTPDAPNDDGYTLIFKLISAAKVCVFMLLTVVLPSVVILSVYYIKGRTNKTGRKKKK